MTLNIDPRRCKVEGCRGWANKTTGYCAGHDPQVQAVASQARKLARRGLKLPPLDSVDAAKLWLRQVGEALARGQIKVAMAGELRRIAKDYCDVDPATSLADKLENLEGQIRDVQQKRGETEPWHG